MRLGFRQLQSYVSECSYRGVTFKTLRSPTGSGEPIFIFMKSGFRVSVREGTSHSLLKP